ncbi:MAG: hypothetical protein PVJ57_03105 [Phycisphaerae bacterium]|jgi:hypothetical protein
MASDGSGHANEPAAVTPPDGGHTAEKDTSAFARPRRPATARRRLIGIAIGTGAGIACLVTIMTATGAVERSAWDSFYAICDRLGAEGAAVARAQREGWGCFRWQPTPPPDWAMNVEGVVVYAGAVTGLIVSMAMALVAHDALVWGGRILPRCERCGAALRHLEKAACPNCGTPL